MNAKVMFDKASPDTQLLVAANLAIAQAVLRLGQTTKPGSFVLSTAKPLELLQKELDLLAAALDSKSGAA